jgi:AraC-like DNA-binding protein
MSKASRTSIYRSWAGMISRCSNPKDKDYADYGGRGIRVCPRWKESFANFGDDMGPKPNGMSLDRRDNNGNYEPANCRWATRSMQMNNTRRNRHITFNRETLTLTEWARRRGVHPGTLYNRLQHGWEVERALTPVRNELRYRTTLKTVSRWARELGLSDLSYSTVKQRLQRGWPMDAIFERCAG